jgi:hypothetical protein
VKRAFAVAAFAVALLPACSRYDDNDLRLITVYSAKMTCSCLFVMKRDEDFCSEWARQDPNVKTVSIDYDRKRVESQALGMWGAKAHWVDARRGCVVEGE